MKELLKGRAWVLGNNVDTDQVIPAEYLVTMDNRELASHTFENAVPEFAKKVRPGDMIIAGRNFGCGSSREHAPRGLMGAGVSCVVAESFARIFFRNSINLGLPVIEAELHAKTGDAIEIDLKRGVATNTTRHEETIFKGYPPFVMMLIQKGGLVPYTKEMLGCKE